MNTKLKAFIIAALFASLVVLPIVCNNLMRSHYDDGAWVFAVSLSGIFYFFGVVMLIAKLIDGIFKKK